jgi:uncharacterized membrane protein
MDRAALLRTIPMFEGLTAEDAGALAGALAERTYKAGVVIFNQGDPGATMYIVAAGHVNIYLPGEASQRVSLKDLARGEYFGELALFDDKPRSASVLATTETTLLELTRETLGDYLEKRPLASLTILRTISDRLRETNVMLSERAAKNVSAEIDKNLSWPDRLADRIAELNGSWAFVLFVLGLTGVWVLGNLDGIARHLRLGEPFDPYPFVFYNLFLTIVVGFQGPLIVMSQNRSTLKDRAQAATDFKVNLKNEVNVETILREMGEFRIEFTSRVAELERRERSAAE